MDTSISNHSKNLATIIQVATFGKYFFPFGNIILPLILWTVNKKQDAFVEHHGREALNFQLSMMLYGIILICIALPILIIGGMEVSYSLNDFHIDGDVIALSSSRLWWVMTTVIIGGFIALGLWVMDTFYTVEAAIKANRGELYKYPLSIRFIKPEKSNS